MRSAFPILAAIVASALLALFIRLIGDYVPGDGFDALGNIILIMIAGFTIVPPIAFGVTASRQRMRRLPLAIGIMLVLQIVFLIMAIVGLASFSSNDGDLMLLSALIVVVPTLAGSIALAVTGNFGPQDA